MILSFILTQNTKSMLHVFITVKPLTLKPVKYLNNCIVTNVLSIGVSRQEIFEMNTKESLLRWKIIKHLIKYMKTFTKVL